MPSALTPAVTVIVASYNYERYLGAALASVLAQSVTDFELLVVEDGSTDNSATLAKELVHADSRTRLLTHADGKNHGLPATLALGIARAQGRWTAFLEADDLWLPHCLEQRLDTARNSGAGVVCNDVDLMPMPGADAGWFEGYVPRVMRWHGRQSAQKACGPGAAYRADNAFFLENKIPTFSCAMVRTDLLRRVRLDAPVPRWLDWWVWAQLARLTCFAFVPEKLTRWRLHSQSWHNKVKPARYLEDYRAMGRGLRAICQTSGQTSGRTSGHTGQGRMWAALAFLRLPAVLRLALRLSLPLFEDGLRRTFNRVRGRLHVPGRGWRGH